MALADNTNSTLQIIDPNQTTTLTLNDLMALPKTTVNAALFCYGKLVTSGDWSGVKISDLLSQVGVTSDVGSINFLASDGYTAAISIETAMRSDVIIAYALDGNSLTENLRLVIPGANGNLWIAMITALTLSATKISNDGSKDMGTTATNQYEYHGLTNATEQTSPSQPQAQATMPPENKPTIAPTATPANTTQTQPNQKATNQNSGLQSSSSPVEYVYLGLLGAAVAVFVVGFAVYRHKLIKV
jgi:DMSO/TMAO reductase YedYZ molybdopterin-dependent catalytic subunit